MREPAPIQRRLASAFRRTVACGRILSIGRPYDRDGLRRDVQGAVSTLLSDNPGIGAIVFECTNLPPFSEEVSREFGLPVYDIITLGRWFYSGLIQSACSQSRVWGSCDAL